MVEDFLALNTLLACHDLSRCNFEMYYTQVTWNNHFQSRYFSFSCKILSWRLASYVFLVTCSLVLLLCMPLNLETIEIPVCLDKIPVNTPSLYKIITQTSMTDFSLEINDLVDTNFHSYSEVFLGQIYIFTRHLKVHTTIIDFASWERPKKHWYFWQSFQPTNTHTNKHVLHNRKDWRDFFSATYLFIAKKNNNKLQILFCSLIMYIVQPTNCIHVSYLKQNE